METQVIAGGTETEGQRTMGSRRRLSSIIRDPRLRGTKRTVALELDDRAAEVLTLHSMKTGRRKGDIATQVILDNLPCYVVQERRSGDLATSSLDSAGLENPSDSTLPIAETVPSDEDTPSPAHPGQGRGKRRRA